MDVKTFFGILAFLLIVGSMASLMTDPDKDMPAAPISMNNITNFSTIVQIPLMSTATDTTCTALSSNASDTCYYQYNSCVLPGCPTICYNTEAGWLNFSGIVHSLYCLAEGFFWLVAVVVNFFIMLANFVIWIINVGIAIIGILIQLGLYLAALIGFFTGLTALLVPDGTSALAFPQPLGFIVGIMVLFGWILVVAEFVRRMKAMVFPQ